MFDGIVEGNIDGKLDGSNVGSFDGNLDGLAEGTDDELGPSEFSRVGGIDDFLDGDIDDDGNAVGLFDGKVDEVGETPDIVKSVISLLSKLEAVLITSLSTLSLYHPLKMLPVPNLSYILNAYTPPVIHRIVLYAFLFRLYGPPSSITSPILSVTFQVISPGYSSILILILKQLLNSAIDGLVDGTRDLEGGTLEDGLIDGFNDVEGKKEIVGANELEGIFDGRVEG